MKTIKTIIRNDITGLIKHPFCLIIVVGACFLAALYAWANIYSNWDPYGNTGNLKLAAVSLDEGYTTEDGKYENAGDALMKELRKNDKIDWQFVDSKKEAVAGVEDGTYYGAVVVSKKFTYNMYNVFSGDIKKPVLVFYQNQKINPVATKISDTVVGTIQNNINEKFVSTMTATVFAGANDLSKEIKEDGGVDGLIKKIKKVRDQIDSYIYMIDAASIGNDVLSRAAQSANKDTKYMKKQARAAGKSLHSTSKSLKKSQNTISDYKDEVDLTIETITTTLSNMEGTIRDGTLTYDLNRMADAAEKCADDTTTLITEFDAIEKALRAQISGATSLEIRPVEDALDAVDEASSEVLGIQMRLNNTTELTAAKVKKNNTEVARLAAKELSTILSSISSLQDQVNNSLVPKMNKTMKSLEETVDKAGTLMDQLSVIMGDMDGVFDAFYDTIASGDKSLATAKETLQALSNKLTNVIDRVEQVSEDEKVEVLIQTLSGDPKLYGEFFSEPVLINTEKIYPVENYGSAVTPFYTVLAIWVGALILTAILRVSPDRERYPGAKPHELFFGRYATFFLFSQLQAFIIVMGDLNILKVQCVHPYYFALAASLAALTFSLLIFSLVVAFGDVGKALAVVIVVLQIAGSSGTYPIELLPEFFRRLYIFFPFPYAINAMRECIAGRYEMDYVIYLIQLLLFVIVALAIGIWIRKPFFGLMEFMEERMEDTGLL